MRLWTLHPKYLDSKGLVALWREALLAQAVLQDRTKGYRHHPQLDRFRDQPDPVGSIGVYLQGVHEESLSRDYKFNDSKIVRIGDVPKIGVDRNQVEFELEHLRKKLALRDTKKLRDLEGLTLPEIHPLFVII